MMADILTDLHRCFFFAKLEVYSVEPIIFDKSTHQNLPKIMNSDIIKC